MRAPCRAWLRIAVLLSLAGCASPTAAPSRTEPSATSSREFTEDAPPRVIEAAERVLRNLYRKDLMISRATDGFVAERPRDPHAVIAAANEQWQFHANAAAATRRTRFGRDQRPGIADGDGGQPE